VYGLDATDVTEWNEKVRDVAFRIVDSFGSNDDEMMSGRECPKPLAVAETSSREKQTSFHCPICDKVTVGQRQWLKHIGSNRHRKLVKQAANGDGLDRDQQSKRGRRHKRSAAAGATAGQDETNTDGSDAETTLTSAAGQQELLPTSLQIDQTS
jgi:tRNA dimethylallyltransferase